MQRNPSQISHWSNNDALDQPLSKLEISLSCTNLINMDFFSKSDPMIVVSMKNKNTNRWQELGRTETIDDNLNPEFVKKFIVDYFFEEVQNVRFEVYDIDYNNGKLADQDFIGQVELTLAEIAQGTITKELYDNRGGAGDRNRRSHGQIIISAEEINAGDNEKCFKIQARATNVQKLKGFFSSSAPNAYLQLSKVKENGRPTAVYRTNPVKSSNPNYPTFELSARDLCNGDIHRAISIHLVNQASNGDLKTLQSFETTPYELERNPNLSLQDGKCCLTLMSQVTTKPSFLAYMNSGLELNFHVAIDFTASNGDPMTPHSLHYINPNQMNSYEFAINCVGEVLQQYDTDKLFPAYGFGARLPPNGMVSHDFCLSFDPSNPEVHGVNGIIEAYKRSLASVKLYGPTNFSPIIRRVTQHVREMAQETQKLYSVLMILTDGIITDMQQTIEAIVDAADEAMSIVIIGVGEADFTNMEILDGDDWFGWF